MAAEKVKKKKNGFVKFLKVLGFIILGLLLILTGWIIYSALNRKSTLNYVPEEFSVCVQTDSLWDAVEPLLDLKAADMFLSTQELADVRKVVMELRSSDVRNNRLIRFAAKRKAVFSLYEKENGFDFSAVVDMGWLSFATRLLNSAAPIVLPRLDIEALENLNFNKFTKNFSFETEDSGVYFKTVKNLVLVSSSYELLLNSAEGNSEFSEERKAALTKKLENPIRVLADAKKLSAMFLSSNEMLTTVSSNFSEEQLASIEFSLTNTNVDIKANLPLDKSFGIALSAPAFLSRMNANVQYYTLLNIGSLEELKNLVFPMLPAKANADEIWRKANNLSKSIFSINMEDLLFSWTGNEIAVLGLEDKNDPVFAIQIRDEKQRQLIFEKFISSILIKDNSSLILDGVRLSRLELPKFFQDVLALFDVTLPYPYFMVKDNYIYFSESAENLSSIFTAPTYSNRITQTKNWISVSSNQDAATNLCLYYNLERSVPFFLRSNAGISKILQLYSLGRFDLRFFDQEVQLQLQATSTVEKETSMLHGFPLTLEGRNNGILMEGKSAFYWVENDNTLVKMENPSTKILTRQFTGKINIVPVSKTSDKVWVMTEQGEVFVLNDKLEDEKGFPLYTGEKSTTDLITAKNGDLIFPTESKNLMFISTSGSITQIPLTVAGSIKSAPSIIYDGNTEIIQLYDKSFVGKIMTVKNRVHVPELDINLFEIAFGSPASKIVDGKLVTAFITQKGNFYLWKDGILEKGYPLKISGVFNTNVVASDKYFYAISNECVLYRISLSGELLDVKFSYTKAENPLIKQDKGRIFVCGDGNSLYGFNEDMEMLYGFPVAGWGIPVFADANGDKKEDCFVLSVNKKLNAYNLR